MNWKNSPLGIGVVVVVVAAALLGTAMFIGDKGEEAVHLYREAGWGKAQQGNGATPTAMELQGRWRGMSLVAVDGLAARTLGLGEVERGVAVSELSPRGGQTAQRSGLQVGDVITGIDRQPVRDLAGLFGVSRAVSPQSPVLLDVKRRGQPMTLVLLPDPAAQAAPTGEAPEPHGNPAGAPQWGARGGNGWGGQQAARGWGNQVGHWGGAANGAHGGNAWGNGAWGNGAWGNGGAGNGGAGAWGAAR